MTAEKHRNTYILARDAHRAARAEENLLCRYESVSTIQYDTDTDGEQNEVQ